MSSTSRFIDSHCLLAGVHVQVVHVPCFSLTVTVPLPVHMFKLYMYPVLLFARQSGTPFMWLIRHVLGHCSTSLESDDTFINGAFSFQIEVQLPFRQKVVEKRANFEEFVMISMVV